PGGDAAEAGREPPAPTAALGAGGLAYAGDVPPETIAAADEVVVTDSNRRRIHVPSRLVQNAGPVLAASEAPSIDAAVLNPFPRADAQTVAVYDGIEAISAPSSPGFPQFPENRPFAAIDGDPHTQWQADRALVPERHVLSLTFTEPREIATLDLLPYNDRTSTVLAVEVQGRRYDVKRGWNRLDVGLRAVKTLTVRIAQIHKPAGLKATTGGIRELRIDGLQAREALRPPTLAERAVSDDAALTYLFQRTTGDDPFRRTPKRGPSGAALARDRLDGETGLTRVFSPPTARTYDVDGWASAAATAPDDQLDRLVGGPAGFTSSARFEGRPGFRASSAFDGTPRPWIGAYLHGRTAWIEWTGPRQTIDTLTLAPVAGVRRPTRVRLVVDGVPSPPVDVTGDTVRFPPARGSRFRLEILAARGDAGARERRAVGIAEIRGTRTRATVPRTGQLSDACVLTGTVGGRPLRLRALGTIQDLDAGRPLRVLGCEPVTLPAGSTRLQLPAGVLAPYLLRLRSGTGAAPPSPGRVLDAGRASTNGTRTGIRLQLDAPARLVLAESYNRGRRATCDDEDLGEPEVGAAFGTAWHVPASCREVKITFAPNRLVLAGYVVSLVAVLALVAVLVWPRRRAAAVAAGGEAAAGATTRRVPARDAALVAVPAGLALGFVFAARAVPLFALVVFITLWRGIGARRLAFAGGAILAVAVPVLTLFIRPDNRGGFNPEYAQQGIAVHWVAVAGVTLLILALARELSTARARRGPARSAPPSAAAPPPRAP
ncbi:hypothetical protein, partial [Solirubrobacter deserti]